MPKFGDLKWVMFQFPSNTRLCEAIHILLVIKLLLGVNYHHHAPRCYSTDLDQRSILLPIHYKIHTRTYIQHGGRNCKFINFEIVCIKHILEPNAGVLARNARPLQRVFILARPTHKLRVFDELLIIKHWKEFLNSSNFRGRQNLQMR